MTDLTYCYRHMTSSDIYALDELETSDFETGNLSDEELEIPYEMIPPNPDDADTLPSQVHPSYPYGDPTRLTHPASFPRIPYDPTSRALFEDASSGLPGLRWRDLALDLLLPVDPDKAEATRAALARKQASGTGNPAGRGQQAPLPVPPDPDDEFEDVDGSEEESDEDDDEGGSEEEEEDDEEEGEGDEEEEEEEEEGGADYSYVPVPYMPHGYTHFFPTPPQ